MSRFLPKILHAARSAADFARNWRLVWSGALADNRSLKGHAGEYRVQVQPPLKVTDDGLTIDLQDPQWQTSGVAAPGLPAGGAQGQVLRKAGGGDYQACWFEGFTGAVDLVSGFRYDIASHCLQTNTRTLTFADGLLVSLGDVSEWSTVDGGLAVECTQQN